jgi:hypothetical protein
VNGTGTWIVSVRRETLNPSPAFHALVQRKDERTGVFRPKPRLDESIPARLPRCLLAPQDSGFAEADLEFLSFAFGAEAHDLAAVSCIDHQGSCRVPGNHC